MIFTAASSALINPGIKWELPFVIEVSTKPGFKIDTWIPNCFSCNRSAVVHELMADLEAEYEEAKFWYSADDQNVKGSIKWKAGCQINFGSEIVT